MVTMVMLFIADVSRCAFQAMSEVSRLKSCRPAVSVVLAGNERMRSDYYQLDLDVCALLVALGPLSRVPA